MKRHRRGVVQMQLIPALLFAFVASSPLLCAPQDGLPVRVPVAESAAVASDSDQIGVRRCLVGVGDFQEVDGLLLVDKDAQPTLANVGHLTLTGQFDTASVLADDSNREPVPVSKVGDREWLIKGSGRVIVVATLATREPFGIEQRRYDITIPSLSVEPVDPDIPDPIVPEPSPPSAPSPFEGEGIRILIVYELDEMASYSPSVLDTMYSKDLRLWAVNNCAKDVGGQPELRLFDDDVQNQPERWMKALSRPRGAMPWLIVGNGKKGYEGPLPPTEEATLALLETFK